MSTAQISYLLHDVSDDGSDDDGCDDADHDSNYDDDNDGSDDDDHMSRELLHSKHSYQCFST